jgi:eukaryotic-like serine/threonine-protein kinase
VDSLSGKVLGGRYELRGEVGRGAMGIVYEAWDVRLCRITAVKVLTRATETDERSVRRFRREATVLARLSSPRIVQVFDCGETEEGTPFLVMEFVRGTALDVALRQEELTVDASLRTVVEVCEGLQVAHEAGVVHRDLKPANVILTDDGARVVDFGIAAIVTEEIDRSASLVAGTPRTMSPEQLLGERTSARSDVFAIGVLAYRLLAGHYPFVADSMAAQMFAILKGHIPLHEIAPVSQGVSACVSKALSPDPSQRQESAKAFADELLSAFQKEPCHSGTERPRRSESTTFDTLTEGGEERTTVDQSNASFVTRILAQGALSSSNEENHPALPPAAKKAKHAVRIWSRPGTAVLALTALAGGLLAATYSRAPAAVPSSTAISVLPPPKEPPATALVPQPSATVAVPQDVESPRKSLAPGPVRLPRPTSAATPSPARSIPTEASPPPSGSPESTPPLPKYL